MSPVQDRRSNGGSRFQHKRGFSLAQQMSGGSESNGTGADDSYWELVGLHTLSSFFFHCIRAALFAARPWPIASLRLHVPAERRANERPTMYCFRFLLQETSFHQKGRTLVREKKQEGDIPKQHDDAQVRLTGKSRSTMTTSRHTPSS